MKNEANSPQGCSVDERIAIVVRPLQEYMAMSAPTVWREVAVLSFGAQKGVDAIARVETSIAPVIMELGIRIERDLSEANKDMTPADLATATLSAFDGAINAEVVYLRQHHGWEKTDLPTVAHQAVRKIRGALEFGGSLRELGTTNKCAEFARDRKKERNEKAKAALDALRGDTATADGDVQLPPEVQQSLDELIALAKQAAIMDATTANAAIVKARNAMNNIVQTARQRLAKRAEQKAA